MRKIVILMTLAATFAVAGCNTVSGAGKDVKSVGGAVTETAEDARQ